MADLQVLNILNANKILEEAQILADRPYRRYHSFVDPFEYYSDSQVPIYKVISPFQTGGVGTN